MGTIKQAIWWWYWGFSQDELHLHSPKLKFTNFDKMKEHSAKHSAEYQWVGSGYWSNYDKEEIDVEVADVEDWCVLEGDVHDKVLAICEPLEPNKVSNSLHITEHIYEVNGEKFRFLWCSGENEPQIEMLNPK